MRGGTQARRASPMAVSGTPGNWVETEQLGLELVLLWNVGVTGRGPTYYTTSVPGHDFLRMLAILS